jgi:LPXTG-motif cell wall-anchored protein
VLTVAALAVPVSGLVGGTAFAADADQVQADAIKKAADQAAHEAQEAAKKAAEAAKREAEAAQKAAAEGATVTDAAPAAIAGPTLPAALKVAGPVAPAATTVVAAPAAKKPDAKKQAAKPANASAGKNAAGPTGCTEDSFLNSASPASGSTVNIGQKISVLYSDESPLNDGTVIGRNGVTATKPSLTVDGNNVSSTLLTQTPQATGPDKYNVLLSFVVPTLSAGTHVFALKAYDSDQNKQGGDCGVASWTLMVNTPPVTPPVTPPAPPVTPPAPPVITNGGTPQPVQGPVTPAKTPTKPATALPFTGDSSSTHVQLALGLLLIGAGLVLIGRRPQSVRTLA